MVIFNSYVSLPEGNAVLVKKGISLVEKKTTGAFYVGNGWVGNGVAGMMTLLVMTGIIPKNSLLYKHQ